MGEDRPTKYAVHCGVPLIPTMVFRKAEFYCLECGAALGMFSPMTSKATPELHAKYDELKAEWDEHASGVVPNHEFWRSDCPRCSGDGEPHPLHMTDEEREADRRGREWLRERAGVSDG